VNQAPLHADSIWLELTGENAVLECLEIFDTLDSTNAYLLRQPIPPRRAACLAEFQTEGRGRRGRDWLSPHGAGLCLSVKYCAGNANPHGLSLALGVATADVLRALGVDGLALKWPNDVWRHGKKLGGILVETRVAPDETLWVAGLGLNLAAAPADMDGATDLRDVAVSRNRLAGRMIAAWLAALDQFTRTGWTPWQHAWASYDALAGQAVVVHEAHSAVSGVACGLAADGALRVRTAAGERCFYSGDVTVRRA